MKFRQEVKNRYDQKLYGSVVEDADICIMSILLALASFLSILLLFLAYGSFSPEHVFSGAVPSRTMSNHAFQHVDEAAALAFSRRVANQYGSGPSTRCLSQMPPSSSAAGLGNEAFSMTALSLDASLASMSYPVELCKLSLADSTCMLTGLFNLSPQVFDLSNIRLQSEDALGQSSEEGSACSGGGDYIFHGVIGCDEPVQEILFNLEGKYMIVNLLAPLSPDRLLELKNIGGLMISVCGGWGGASIYAMSL